MNGQENVDINFGNVLDIPKKGVPVDPAGRSEHLTSKGKRKPRVRDRGLQQANYEQRVDDRANEIISSEVTATPGDNLKVKEKKIQGIDD